VEKESVGSRQASAPSAKPLRSAGSFEGSWGWDDSSAAQQQQHGACYLLGSAGATSKAHAPPAGERPSLRSTHSAADLGSGGNYTVDQLNASAAGKDQFFARKLQENASRYANKLRRHRCGALTSRLAQACGAAAEPGR
jgi:hypothetical protein